MTKSRNGSTTASNILSDNHMFNLHSVGSQDEVDKLNKEFYGRFNFPWYPSILSRYKEQDFWIKALNQDIGSWDHTRIGSNPKIWVAGCGTNQAVITALKYPDAHITGTDLSTQSLEASRALADKMGVTNLTLEEISLNVVEYEDEFDVVVCTGVIHHNSDPSIPLRALSRALKKNGILELFVYNYYHRVMSTAFQKAIRMLCSEDGRPNIDLELPVSAAVIEDSSGSCGALMQGFLAELEDAHESRMADAILQPVEHSYTVETFNQLVNSCDLSLVQPVINQWDKARDRLTWELEFGDKKNKDTYQALTDINRWQVGNLLLLEESPHVWFYVQRKDCDFPIKSTQQICQEFLKTRFKKARTNFDLYVRLKDGSYLLSKTDERVPAPIFPVDAMAASVFEHVNGTLTIEAILLGLDVDLAFYVLNDLRLRLTTTAFPYIVAV